MQISKKAPLFGLALSHLVGSAVPQSNFDVTLFPQPIHREPCHLPPNAQATVGHFLMGFFIEPEGTIADVKPLYASLEPEENRAAVEAGLQECMGRWRYKTNSFGSKAMTAFHFFGPGPWSGPTIRISDEVVLAIAQIEEMKRAKVGFARYLLAGTQHAEDDGAWWHLETDTGADGLMELREGIEFAARAFATLFPGVRLGDGKPMNMLVFLRKSEYDQVAMFDSLVPKYGSEAGHYTPWDQMAYTAVAGQPMQVVRRVVTHEATHHLLSRAFRSSERALPRWVSEGTASFIECLRPTRKEIQLQKVHERPYHKGRLMWPAPGEHFVELLQSALRHNALPSLQKLLDEEIRGALSGGSRNAYAFAWLAVHFFVNGADGAYRDSFRRWLADMEGGTDAASIEAALGKPVSALDAEIRRYLRRL